MGSAFGGYDVSRFVFLLLLWAYLYPTYVAIERNVPFVLVFVINLFLGWTIVGWVVALKMAKRSMPGRSA